MDVRRDFYELLSERYFSMPGRYFKIMPKTPIVITNICNKTHRVIKDVHMKKIAHKNERFFTGLP
jgi:hypothetical protein